MTAPAPRALDRDIDRLCAEIRRVGRDYAYLYPSGYHRARRGGGGGGRSNETPDVSSMFIQGKGAIAVPARAREACELAAKKLADALDVVKAARAHLNDAYQAIDKATPLEIEQNERALEHPADAGDRKRAEDARDRRELRSRRTPWGSDEVTG